METRAAVVVGRATEGGVAMMIPLVDDDDTAAAAFEDELGDELSSFSYSSSPSSSSLSTSPGLVPCFGGRGSKVLPPERLRRRMAEWESRNGCGVISVDCIEAKLRDAHHRRQEFYDQLSKKASPKRISTSQSRCSSEELEQRIEARLQAAEEKRLSILAKAQKRLARMDEMRQAARTGVEIRKEEERKKLSKRVELRFQQAEANRIHRLKRERLRRASLKERTSQSILRRMAKESRYKERICASIHQKRVAAEKKRMSLLEAEKRRARARFIQVRLVASSVFHQREVERRKLRDEIEHRLQKAKKQRAEYLKQRGRGNSKKDIMHEHGDILSRKLARCWSDFAQKRKTTVALAKEYDELKINEKHVRSMPFEQLAHLIESRATLQVVKPFLDRLETRFKLSITLGHKQFNTTDCVNIDHLLKIVAPPRRKVGRNSSVKSSRKTDSTGPLTEPAKAPKKLSRYPVRLVLCAYMIITHPDAVFSGKGEFEMHLASSAANFIREFEKLLKTVFDGPTAQVMDGYGKTVQRSSTFRTQLAVFDNAWCAYLNDFVVWKRKDAEALELDLVRTACQLELSMMQKCKLTKEGDSCDLTHDLKAIKEQVADDQKMLRQKIIRLSGDDGVGRLESALSDTRTLYFEELEKGSLSSSPTTPFLLTVSPPTSSSASSSFRRELRENSEGSKQVARSLFKEEPSLSADKASSSTAARKAVDESHRMNLVTENEFIVNEFLHGKGYSISDSLEGRHGEVDNTEERVRETMEAAFWDGVMESMKQVQPNYGRLIELFTEVRDGICEISPASWKEEINEVIDLAVLTKMLSSGNLDVEFFGRILKFALTTLQKLSAPANDEEIRGNHETFLKELDIVCKRSDESVEVHITALVKGIRYVLEQMQALKKEISKSYIGIAGSVLNGPAGEEYLKTAFSDRHGPPYEAATHLPSTLAWLSSVKTVRDEEWNEHATLARNHIQLSVPPAVLKTGRIILEPNRSGVVHASDEPDLPECRGDIVDSMVRLGTLKLANRVTGLTLEILPETLQLNLFRLRSIQGELQKIIVILTSTLVTRQVLLSEPMAMSSSSAMENLLQRLIEQLSKLLETDKDAGMEQITGVINSNFKEVDQTGDTIKLQARTELVARMLMKSLQAGDPVFERVSAAVYRASRGVVLGGSGLKGRELAKVELQKMGATSLVDELVEAANQIGIMANVSVRVHGEWYADLVGKMNT